MSQYTAAIVGTGPDPHNPTGEGFAMGYRHAESYLNDDRVDVVACADVVPEHAAAFAAEFDLADDAVFEDYEAMLAAVEPDLVSVCVPPALHEELVVGCARSGHVAAVHCEKPMALTWGGARRMVEACEDAGVQLTFNRQRRFGAPFREAKRLVEDGEIGALRRVEIGWGNLFDNGAHTIDLANAFVGEGSAEWVLAGLDYREERLAFGAHQENQAWAQWHYGDGVYGTMSTGEGSSFVDAGFVLRGSDGRIRIDVEDGPMLELRRGGETDAVDVGDENMHGRLADWRSDRFGSTFIDRAIEHVVDCLETGEEPELSGRRGLAAEEVTFAGYESVRRRARVDLPLEIEGNPLEEMVEDGTLQPAPGGE